MAINSFRDLLVWQKAMDMVVAAYSLTRQFPDSERFGLTSQLQRAAVSVPANIAEGRGRRGTKDFLRYLSIAYGSLAEMETHVLIANRLSYIAEQQVSSILEQVNEVRRMIDGLQTSLRRRLE